MNYIVFPPASSFLIPPANSNFVDKTNEALAVALVQFHAKLNIQKLQLQTFNNFAIICTVGGEDGGEREGEGTKLTSLEAGKKQIQLFVQILCK